MNNVLLLTKVLIKNSFRGGKNQKIPTYLILSLILIPCLGIPIYLGIEYLASSYINYGINPLSLLSIILPIGFVFILVTSIFSVISTYFLSSDINNLLPLPFRPWEIIIAKFFASLVIVYVFLLSLLFPILLGLGVGANADFVYYIYSIIITIMFPIAPTAILSLLITSLMRFSTKSKSKDKFTYIVSIIAIVFSFGLSFGSNTIINNIMENTEQTIITLQDFIDKFGETMLSIFFILYPSYLALTNTKSMISIIYILISVIIPIIFVILFALISKVTYLKGIMGGKASKTTNKDESKILNIKRNSPFMAMVLKDIKSIWRSPSFNMNLLLAEILIPIFIIVSVIIGFFNGDDNGALISEFLSNISLKNAFTFGIFFVVGCVFASTSLASPTAISREGKNASFLKAIPISTTTIIHSKMFFGIVSCFIIYLIIGIPIVLLGYLSFLDFIILTISVFPFTILMNYVGILLDVRFPKLTWDNENVPVKQNFNGVIYMFSIWIIGGLITFISYYVPFNGYILSLIICFVSLLGCFIFYKYIKKKDIELFKKIG